MQSNIEPPIIITSISEFISHFDVRGTCFVYRGQSQDWQLIPSIGRVHRGGHEKIKEFECHILSEFRRLGSPYFERPPSAVEEWILHAQHYRLPTRLLDWTTNPLKALYFSVEDKNNSNDGVVWGSDSLNINWDEELPSIEEKKPYFHRPAHLNNRIVAQEGIFLVFPIEDDQEIIEPADLYDDYTYGHIEKFIIPAKSKEKIKWELSSIGINSMSIYPSIEGVVSHIRDEFFMDLISNDVNSESIP